MTRQSHPETESFETPQSDYGLGWEDAPQVLFGHDADAAGIVSLIARERHIPVGLILHPSRCQAGVVEARQLAMYLMHVSLQRSLTEIGIFFGRDRTTVGHACARMEDRRDDPRFEREVRHFEDLLADASMSLPRWLKEKRHGRT